MQQGTCTVSGCEKPARSSRAEWCKMHYHRWYRHGDVNRVATSSGVTASHGRRYRMVKCPGHPLANKHGRAYGHRVVLYNTIGPGAHPCHWCSKRVTWDATRGDAECLAADHLNGIGDDNRSDNLVPSCVPCNTARAMQARADALREAGWWSRHDTVGKLGSRLPRVTAHAQ